MHKDTRTITWYNRIEDFLLIAKEWDDALALSGQDNPFLLSDFISTWWKHYHDARQLYILCVKEDGLIVFGLPLVLERKGVRSVLTHIGGYAANLTHPLIAKPHQNQEAGRILKQSLAGISGWDILELERVLSSQPFCESMRKTCPATQQESLACDIQPNGLNGQIDLACGHDAIITRLPSRLRRYLKSGAGQARRTLGNLCLQRQHGAAQIKQLLDDYATLSIASFKSRKKESAFDGPVYREFFNELLVTLDSKNMLDAHRLCAGPHTLAISFAYRFGKGFKWILTAFNSQHAQLRPGHLLLSALIKEAIQREDPYFDMYYGGELLYKQQWCDIMTPLCKVRIYKNTLANRCCVGIEKSIRKNTAAMNMLRMARQRLR